METILVLYKKNIINLTNINIDLNLYSAYYKNEDVLKFKVPKDFTLSKADIDFLSTQKIDWGVIPKKFFSDIKLVISDMDSTFINIECIDEVAHFMGLKDQISLITERAMRGEIDFTASLKQRCFLLKGVSVDALQYVYDNILRVSDGVETFLYQCKQAKIKFILASGGFTFFTDKLRSKYVLDCSFANNLEIKHGLLTGNLLGDIVDDQYKLNILKQYENKLQIKKDQIIAIGDGANDILMLEAAGFGIAYHAKDNTKKYSNIHVDFNNFEAIRYFFD